MGGDCASAVKYSPFYDDLIAVSAGTNYGLVGNGRLWVMRLTQGGIVAEKRLVASFGMHTPQMIINHC